MHMALRNKMAAGQPLFGLLSLIHHPTIVELAGWCGADYIVIDGEHTPLDQAQLGAICRAAELANIVPVVRVFMNAGTDLLPYLDMGFQGVMVPHLKTVRQAEEMVRYTQFPPWGERSISPGRVSAYLSKRQTQGDLKTLSQSMLVIAQIEDAEAVENFEALLDVEGIDIFNIGPADLAGSLGHPGEPQHPDVRKAMTQMIEAAGRKERFTGNPGWNDEVRRDFFAKAGRSFLTPDTTLLAAGLRDRADEIKAFGAQTA